MLLLFLTGNYEKNSTHWSANPVQKNTEQLKSFICRTAALVFVLICFVHLAWQQILQSYQEWMNLLHISKTTWIAGTFHTAEWNLYETEGPRTNNHLEGWHNCLWRVVGKSHPNIFECVEVFQREQVSTEVRYSSLQQVHVHLVRKRKLQRKISTLRYSKKDLAV